MKPPVTYKCCRCRIVKVGWDFSLYPTGKRDKTCKLCRAADQRKRRRRNPKQYTAEENARNEARRRERIEWIFKYLAEHPCVDCGERDPIVLEFDHVRGEKAGNIAAMLTLRWPAIEAEIAKCDIRCANCHRRRTALDRGYYAYLGSDHEADKRERLRRLRDEAAGQTALFELEVDTCQ